jgi:hypothetical protein
VELTDIRFLLPLLLLDEEVGGVLDVMRDRMSVTNVVNTTAQNARERLAVPAILSSISFAPLSPKMA